MLSSAAVSRLGRAVSPVIETLEGRTLMSASILAGSSVLVFNSVAVGNAAAAPGKVVNLTLTDAGDAQLSFPANGISIVSDPAAPAADASAFNLVTAVPAGVAAGASTVLGIQYTASRVGVQSAFLQILSNDPANPLISIPLHGIGTAGTGGGFEPSLAEILREFNIPTIVGDGANDANAFTSTYYPAVPDASSQELPMQTLMKAGTGPVSITLLASFAVSNNPASRFGYYIPGDQADRTELFSIGQADSQTVNPTALGATSFDPGSAAFGLYANFPTFTDSGHQRLSFSEDALNGWDGAVPRKIRFFPLKNADGSIVANAYIFAAEDNNIPFGSIQPYDSNDVVGIIRNVQAAPSGAVFGLENLSGLPSTTQLAFNRIQNLNSENPSGFVDLVHDTNTLRIRNTGSQPLQISSVLLSDAVNWMIVNPPAPGTTIAPGGTFDLTIKFIAQTVPAVPYNEINAWGTVNGILPEQAGGVWNGTLTITTNAAVNPVRTLKLAGFWQNTSENENEPGLQTILNLVYGYGTNVSSTQKFVYPNGGTIPFYYGEETISAYWNAADPTLPVAVTQLASYHNQFDHSTWLPAQASIGWYNQGSSSVQWLFKDQAGNGQTLLPTINGSNTKIASGTFKPTGAFGWNLDGENSLDSANSADLALGRSGHAVRFYPARDAAGNLIPNAFFVTMDYQGGAFDNSDFQDNIYLVTNMRPASRAPSVTDLQVFNDVGGVTLQWAPISDPTLKGYNVYRATSPAGPWSKLNATAFADLSYTDPTAAAGAVYYRVAALDAAGESLGTNAVIQVAAAAPAVNDALTSLDVNAQPAGSTTVVKAGHDYNITGGGADIAGTAADGFRYAYQPVTGDFDVQVQVTSLTNVQSGTRAGLMLRTSTDPGAQMIFVGPTASDGYRFNYRSTANAVGSFQKYGSVTYPNAWVRLVRQGNVFTGYYSTDGVTWTKMQALTLALPATLDLGLAVCSHTNTQAATAAFRHYNLTGGNAAPNNTGGDGGTVIDPTPVPPVVVPPVTDPTGTGGTGGTPALSLAEQVAADRASLKDAIARRIAGLAAAKNALKAHLKAYGAALHDLRIAQAAAKRTHQSPDATLSEKVAGLLGTVTSNRTTLSNLLKTDFTGIAADKKELAADLAALKLSKRQH